MWKDAGKVQDECLNICKKMHSIVEKLRQLDEEVIFEVDNIPLYLNYGRTMVQMVQVFRMNQWKKQSEILNKLCDESGNGLPQNECEKRIVLYQLFDLILAISGDVLEICKKGKERCECCDQEVYYLPVSSVLDLYNEQTTICPCCEANRYERRIIAMLKWMGLSQHDYKEKLLLFTPAEALTHWINRNCMALQYDFINLGSDEDIMESDIQDMKMTTSEEYDYIIYTYLSNYKSNDKQIFHEWYRILKQDGFVIVSVFGDNSDKIKKELNKIGFYVYTFRGDSLEDEVYHKDNLTDDVVLYVVTKSKCNITEMIQKKKNALDEKSQPLVSVLMSAYNHEKYVADAIESVLGQTYTNIEFLVADDCSTDETAEVICKYKDQITEIHLFEANACGRLQFLRERAKGKYIAVINSDDTWDKDKLRQQVLYLETHPETAACFTGTVCVKEDGTQSDLDIFLQDNMKKEEWMHHFFYCGNCLACPSILIETKVYQSIAKNGVGMFRQIPDFYMWVKLVQQYEIHVIEKTLVYFRVHESGNNANTSARTIENNIRYFHETAYMWYDTFRKMDNNYFQKAFKKELACGCMKTSEEILCEKFLVLRNSKEGYLQQTALFFAYDIWKNDRIVELLEHKYNFKTAELYEIAAKGWDI